MTITLFTTKQTLKDLSKHTNNVGKAYQKLVKEPTFDNLLLAKVAAKNCAMAYDRALTDWAHKIAKEKAVNKKKKKKKSSQLRPRGLGL